MFLLNCVIVLKESYLTQKQNNNNKKGQIAV